MTAETSQEIGRVERIGVGERMDDGGGRSNVQFILLEGSARVHTMAQPLRGGWGQAGWLPEDGRGIGPATELALTQAGDEVRLTYLHLPAGRISPRPERMLVHIENLTLRRRQAEVGDAGRHGTTGEG